jgi:hypothetical protein
VSENRELVEALAIANEDRAQLRAALENADRERAQAGREQQEAERWLRQLESSRSWRLTRPLRDGGAALRSLARRVSARPGRRV